MLNFKEAVLLYEQLLEVNKAVRRGIMPFPVRFASAASVH